MAHQLEVSESESETEYGETRLIGADDGAERSVGRCPRPPGGVERRRNPYVFISHTGRDGVKEEIARPTN